MRMGPLGQRTGPYGRSCCGSTACMRTGLQCPELRLGATHSVMTRGPWPRTDAGALQQEGAESLSCAPLLQDGWRRSWSQQPHLTGCQRGAR